MTDRKTLVVADFDLTELDAMAQVLEDRGFSVARAGTGPEVLARVARERPDLVVLPPLLPRRNGFDVLRSIRDDAKTRDLPVLLLIDRGDSYSENRALFSGADGILNRPFEPEDLVLKVRSMLTEASLKTPAPGEGDLAAFPSLTEKILAAAHPGVRTENPLLSHITDSLTGLFNAPYLEIKFAEEYKRARRFHVALSCVVLGLDLPDSDSPDIDADHRRLLNELAGLLLCESRDIDILGRLDAGRFVLLLPHTDRDGAIHMAERIIASIRERRFELPRRGLVSASAGVECYAGQGLESGDELLARAMEALESARRSGGGRAVLWHAPAESRPGAP